MILQLNCVNMQGLQVGIENMDARRRKAPLDRRITRAPHVVGRERMGEGRNEELFQRVLRLAFEGRARGLASPSVFVSAIPPIHHICAVSFLFCHRFLRYSLQFRLPYHLVVIVVFAGN